MKARILKQSALDELRADIADNLDRYRTGDFSYLETDPAFSFEYNVDIDADALAELHAPASSTALFEPENCALLHTALEELSPYEARDERFWAYLSHTFLLEHARERWPIPADDEAGVRHIAKHFFARDKRQIERDNVGSRLWWMAHLCARAEGLDQGDALDAFLFRSDVRANLIERPTTSQTTALFSALLTNLVVSYKGKRALFERKAFRHLMREVNSTGGYKLLDCLPAEAVEGIVSDIITNRLALKEL